MIEKISKIVVTGAKGQLGGDLCRMLGERAAPLDIDTLDLTNRQAVHDRILDIRPELIINCAAYTQVDKAETEPDLASAVNAGAVENLIDTCRLLDCPLMQISTDYVFESGTRKTESGNMRPYTEEDEPAQPRGVYTRTKLEGELAAAKWEKHLIVRTCGLYARRTDENAKHFVKTILHLADTRPELRVVNDQYCTPTYVPHFVQAVLFLAGISPVPLEERPTNASPLPLKEGPGARAGKVSAIELAPYGTYHVTNRGQTTWYDFATEILRLADRHIPITPITTAQFAAPAPRPAYSVLNTEKYHSLGGPEMPDWKCGLQAFFGQY
jgi:dTDP-4-dehydrorhamnose reductase